MLPSGVKRALARLQFNLPGWRWAAIKKVALDRLSRSLRSDVCDSDGCCDAVVHSTISGSGNRRTRAVPNVVTMNKVPHYAGNHPAPGILLHEPFADVFVSFVPWRPHPRICSFPCLPQIWHRIEFSNVSDVQRDVSNLQHSSHFMTHESFAFY